MTIEFILLFITLAFASSGAGAMFLYLIRPGQLFSFIQPALVYASKKNGFFWVFIYKSIGGCEICTMQRFADLAFLFLFAITTGISWWMWIALYIAFGGLSYYATALQFGKKKQSAPPSETHTEIKL